MTFEPTWRWFGPQDPITLSEIKQTGARGIVTALHHIPFGEVWSKDEIIKRKQLIEAEKLPWSVAESVPVHEDIHKKKGNYKQYLDNFKETLRNLGQCGIDTVCYNFMPVFDWLRTDLEVEYEDGSLTTQFEVKELAAFDLFILQRPKAEEDYSKMQILEAEKYFKNLNENKKDKLIQAVLLGFPGSCDAYTLKELKSALLEYEDMGNQELQDNLFFFLREIIPVAEENGVFLNIHPDDPPWSVLGLPRVVKNKQDIQQILQVVDSPANGLTFGTGSLAAEKKNDLVNMAHTFASRINFIHLRNVIKKDDHAFVESYHLDGDIDMYEVMKILLMEQKQRIKQNQKNSRLPMRPDHGHHMVSDNEKKNTYPGYSLMGRIRAMAELRGLETAIENCLE